MELYVNKTIDLNKISKKYYIHIWRLHYQIYIPSINSKKKIITKEVVKTYFGELEPKEQFFYLNFTGENFTDIYVQ
jgi:uncharacterized protein (DUF39 family)